MYAPSYFTHITLLLITDEEDVLMAFVMVIKLKVEETSVVILV